MNKLAYIYWNIIESVKTTLRGYHDLTLQLQLQLIPGNDGVELTGVTRQSQNNLS